MSTIIAMRSLFALRYLTLCQLDVFGQNIFMSRTCLKYMTTTPQGFTYIIYKDGNSTVAQKSDKSNPITNVNPEVVMNTVLKDPGPLDNLTGIRAGPGHIYVADGLYDLSSSFQGFDLRAYTTLTLAPQAVLTVDETFTGSVFTLESDSGKPVSDCTIEGGYIRQRGSPSQRQWTGVLLHGVGDGMLFNKIMNSTIRNANIGIELVATSDPDGTYGGWVNGNLFQGLKMWDNDIFIDFQMDGPYKPDTQHTGIHRNRFMNIECQTGSNTKYGVRNIRHFGNSFINVNIWDIHTGGPGATISTVHPDARGTTIISGIMTGQNFSSQGQGTKIIDENYGLI
jgi:hypothetical protein